MAYRIARIYGEQAGVSKGWDMSTISCIELIPIFSIQK